MKIRIVTILTTLCAWAAAAACFAADAPAPASEPSKAGVDLLNGSPKGSIDLKAKPSAKELFEKSYNPNDALSFSTLPDDVFPRLDKLLDAQSYGELNTFINDHLGDVKMGQWLERKANQGHVHLMWNLAEFYARSNTIDLAVKWAYAAMFGTMQESKLCLDPMTALAAGRISQAHPNLLRITRANPFLLKGAKVTAMEILAKATNYDNPDVWLCKPYAAPARIKRGDADRYSYEPVWYPLLRARARNGLRETYQIEQPQEAPPAPPASAGSPP